MKINILRIILFVLILTGNFSSCTKREGSIKLDGDVLYKPCPCEENDEPLGTIKGKKHLFIDPTGDSSIGVLGRMISDGDYAYVDIDMKETDIKKPAVPGAIGNICNFPDFAKQWDTSGGAVTVYFEGILYPHCEAFGCRLYTECFSVVLTKLKIK